MSILQYRRLKKTQPPEGKQPADLWTKSVVMETGNTVQKMKSVKLEI